MTPQPRIVVTCGEPAGIGPELVVRLAQRQASSAPFAADLVVVGDRALLEARAARLGVHAAFAPWPPDRPEAAARGDAVAVWDHPFPVPTVAGRLEPANAGAVLEQLRDACDACATGAFAALVTAPVQKSVMQDAGLAFMGHTEYFAERTGTPRVVMMLVGGDGAAPLRVALVTTHLALRDVPGAVTEGAVFETVSIVARELASRFGVAAPRLAVCGLNPHAGEGGHLGREDVDAIAPAIAHARAGGIDAVGPLPADTVFVPTMARRYDAIVAMYHDQGLPVLKAASFGGGVNVTLGLPFARTSVDHGTALDLAADAALAATADPGSLFAAVDLAIALATPTRPAPAAAAPAA